MIRRATASRFGRPRRTWSALVASLVLYAILTGCGSASSTPARSGPLPWAPPKLVEPVTIKLGDGYTDTSLAPGTDAVIVLPKHDKRGGVTIEGGHNIVIVGGEITVPRGGPPGARNDRFRTAVYIKGATGTVQVEGVLMRGAPGAVWDGVDIDAPRATVQLENLRIEGIRGRYHGFHGDVVQPWGGVADLRINRMTATSNYQGLTLPIDLGPIGSAQISKVNLSGLDRHVEEGGHLLWLTTGLSSCVTYPVDLRGVYIKPRADLRFRRSVWPEVGRPRRCSARLHGEAVTWPNLGDVHGQVRDGVPPGGDFVPTGVAGLHYETPGYATGP